MSEERLAAGLWISAKLRELDQLGTSYYIVNKGAYFSGTVLLKLFTPEIGCRVLTQTRNENAALIWTNALKDEYVAESDADAYIARAVQRDPDLWAIEIESKAGTNPFD